MDLAISLATQIGALFIMIGVGYVLIKTDICTISESKLLLSTAKSTITASTQVSSPPLVARSELDHACDSSENACISVTISVKWQLGSSLIGVTG